jgi:HSP20 family protein
MRSSGEDVKHAKNGEHAVETAKKEQTIPAPIQRPAQFMQRMSDEFDRQLASWGLNGPFFERPGWLQARLSRIMPAWMPEVEVVRKEGTLVVRADVPGATKDNLSVEIVGDELVIRGERKQEETVEENGYVRSERRYGSFYRSIPIPEGADPESAKADLRHGVLEITMTAPEAKPGGRRIEIGS